MIDLFKDRYKFSLLLASLFLIGILASAYQIYRLPHNLMLSETNHPAFVNVYTVAGLTFLIGSLTIWWTLHYKNEVIVFRDKQIDLHNASKDNDNTTQSTISLGGVQESIRQARSMKDIVHEGLHAICKQLEAGQGAVYLMREEEGKRKLVLTTGYALTVTESNTVTYEAGEGLVGQAAVSAKTLYVDDVPEGYVKIISGLGSASPRYLLIVPVKNQDNVSGVMEIASFSPLNEHQRKFVEDSAQLIADKISSK